MEETEIVRATYVVDGALALTTRDVAGAELARHRKFHALLTHGDHLHTCKYVVKFRCYVDDDDLSES
jgi:hypothetical protein